VQGAIRIFENIFGLAGIVASMVDVLKDVKSWMRGDWFNQFALN
jgi:hypothetical protein